VVTPGRAHSVGGRVSGVGCEQPVIAPTNIIGIRRSGADQRLRPCCEPSASDIEGIDLLPITFMAAPRASIGIPAAAYTLGFVERLVGNSSATILSSLFRLSRKQFRASA